MGKPAPGKEWSLDNTEGMRRVRGVHKVWAKTLPQPVY